MRLYGIVMKDRLTDIHMVVTDIDGTLLTSDNRLHPATTNAIASFNEGRDCSFTFCTGRALPLVKPLADHFNVCVPFIYSGGAIFDPVNNKPICSQPIDDAHIESVIEIADHFSVGLLVHTTSRMICRVNDTDWRIISAIEWIKGRRTDHASRIEDLRVRGSEPIVRMDIFSENINLLPIFAALQARNGDLHAVLMNRSIEITSAGVHKGSALHQLVRIMGIDLGQVMAIGDSMNDLQLLKAAGFAVAMETAPQALKAVADRVVPASDHGGVAQALDLIPQIR